MHLLGPGGATLAANGPPTGPTAESMTISGFGVLAAGSYSVQWTTITPDDNGIERGTFSFTVAAAAASGVAASSGAEPTASAAASPAPGGATRVRRRARISPLPVVVLAVPSSIVGAAWFLRRSR